MKRRACVMLRPGGHYKKETFTEGFAALGFQIVPVLTHPYRPDDVLLLWNRYSNDAMHARNVERAGGKVLVAENSYFGKRIAGVQWFALAIGHHNGAGQWPDGDDTRWRALNIELRPFRENRNGQYVVLGQRGFGEDGIRSPAAWNTSVFHRLPKGTRARLRPHPAGKVPDISLEDDLRDAAGVVTWGSSAAIIALTLGVPVYYEFPNWIGATAARHLTQISQGPNVYDAARLAMFVRLAWAQWSASEIESGLAFRTLLDGAGAF